jgi:hypothetical protein
MEGETPSTHGPNGQGPNGRFLPGNRFGRGQPLAGQVAKLRAAMLKAVKVGDVKDIIGGMIDKARGGDVAAAKLVLQYTLGEPQPFDFLERLERLEDESSK